jgi:pimeloyl-ACP methyl ester carboxylesterase
VVVGAEDTLTPPAEAEKLAAGIRSATLARIPGAGHLPNIEQPTAFNEALARFVAGLAA